ncbi:MAG: ATP-binding protein [Verrucomicrobiota bacterium]
MPIKKQGALFVGRERELDQLRTTLDRSRPSVSVVYGRRRVGKSALIRKALEGRPALFFEGLENQATSVQLSNFCLQLAKQSGSTTQRETPKTWREAFLLLEPVLKKRPACLVLDEFQWMANYRSAIVSDLKMVWEQYLSTIPGVSLIMCGSIASFMLKKVVKGSALYGRTDRVVHLREFSLAETARMLPGYGREELLDTYMILGGIPKYQELLRDYPSLYLAIEELGFRENGFLVDEFDRIFVSHFGRNEDYARIVGALATHPHGIFRKALATSARVDLGGGLSRNLADLESAGFIRSIRPISRPANTKLIKYVLSDAYLRFYHLLMRPELASIRSGHSTLRFAALVQKPVFHGWRGRAFEVACMQHAPNIAQALGFHGIEYSFGPYFRAGGPDGRGVQVDLVFDRADNVLTLCEMKCSRNPIGKSVIEEIERKAGLLREAFPGKTVQNVLLYHGSITKTVGQSPYIYATLDSNILFQGGK